MQPPPVPAVSTFAELALPPALVAALTELGYEEPTPIQRQAIPVMLEGRDVLGQAATGTGKTAAFALPLLARLAAAGGDGAPRALVLVPTRELAMQVAEAVHRYGRGLGVREVPIYGGQPMGRQLRALRQGVDVVVATPGRALDHVRRGTLRLDRIEVVVLDEADEMLDMGFAEDLEALLEATPEARQTALFSATIPPRIAAMARKHQRDPARIQVAEAARRGELPRIQQVAYVVARPQKMAALVRLLDIEDAAAALVFCRTRVEVDGLTQALIARGHLAEALHGGLSQDQRDRVMRRLREGTTDVLVATDVAARGLDVERISHVVNFDVPSSPEAYVHRIGRTGRAGREGVAITLVEPREHRLLRFLEQVTKQKIEVRAVPTVADLRMRQLELTRASLREVLLEGDLEPYRVVVDTLSGEFDVVEIAMAAVRLAHVAAGRERDAEEIRAPAPPPRKPKAEKTPRPGKAAARPTPKPGKPRRPAAANGGDVALLSLSIGRRDGVRPGDLVGAIANEAGLPGGAIGAIHIHDHRSVVELPADTVDAVVSALRRTRIKGKKVTVRLEGDEAELPPPRRKPPRETPAKRRS